MFKFQSLCFLLFLELFSTFSLAGNKKKFNDFLIDKNLDSKSIIALELSKDYLSISIDTLGILGSELFRSSTRENSRFGIAIAQRILGCYDVRSGKINRGLKLLTYSKNYFLSNNDFEMICEAMNELGIGYFLQGDLETAGSFFKASIDYGKESPIETNSFLAEVNLAKVYVEKGKIAEAKNLLKHYIQRALYFKKYESVSNGYSLLGEISLSLNHIRTAANYFEKQKFYALKSNNSSYVTRALNNQAINAFYQNQPDKALSLFQEVLKRRKKENFPFNTFDAYFNLARFYYPDKLQISFQYVDSCYQTAKENKLLKQEQEVYQWRFEHFKDQKNKHLIDSMKQVIRSKEMENELTRKGLAAKYQLVKNSVKSDLNRIIFSLIVCSAFLGIRYLFVRKKHFKTADGNQSID
jgi:tetratricopeptide (TPR) repeat protein